jgi:uncharacterized membrane protein
MDERTGGRERMQSLTITRLRKLPMQRAAITKTFMTGLVTVLPIVVTLYLLYWLADISESILGQIIRVFLPDHVYRPGMGLAAGILIIFVVGMLMNAWIIRRWFAWSEHLLYRTPLVKSLYGSIREFFEFFSHPRDKEFLEVVFVPYGDKKIWRLGFVTKTDMNRLLDDSSQEELLAVYLPLSYQIGGMTVILPRSLIRPATIPAEEAWRFVLTAGVAGHADSGPGATDPEL